MKNLLPIAFMLALSNTLMSQIDSSSIKNNTRYCAQLKDGILVVVSDDSQEITSDVTTENGTVIKSNGNIVKRDGVTTVLKEGECVNTQGVVVRLTDNGTRRENDNKVSVKQ
jgi:hypothetical protein